MKKMNYGVILATGLILASCSTFKKSDPESRDPNVQTENRNKEAVSKASRLTSGWPDSSMTAAKEMISKYGDPHETTSDSLIWRNVAPFKKILVHKDVYSHRFPLLHQNSLEHIVDYRANDQRIDDVWKFNGSIVLDRTKGEMSSFADNEAMNVLALNLAHEVMSGRMGTDAARVTYGKETLAYMNGNKTAYTQVLNFGGQYNTADQGESVTNKIRWIGDPAYRRTQSPQKLNLKQAQEEKK